MLLAHADINSVNKIGQTAIFIALHKGRTGAAKVLIDRGIDLRKVTDRGYCILDYHMKGDELWHRDTFSNRPFRMFQDRMRQILAMVQEAGSDEPSLV